MKMKRIQAALWMVTAKCSKNYGPIDGDRSRGVHVISARTVIGACVLADSVYSGAIEDGGVAVCAHDGVFVCLRTRAVELNALRGGHM